MTPPRDVEQAACTMNWNWLKQPVREQGLERRARHNEVRAISGVAHRRMKKKERNPLPWVGKGGCDGAAHARPN